MAPSTPTNAAKPASLSLLMLAAWTSTGGHRYARPRFPIAETQAIHPPQIDPFSLSVGNPNGVLRA